jgi:dienelactone hydrolase
VDVKKTVSALGVLATLAASMGSPGPARVDSTAHAGEVSFVSGGETLRGVVYAPPRNGQRRPAMVLVSASGPTLPREAVRALVEPFTRAGIVTLTYEKRTAGYSATERSYSQLAEDALAGVRLLRERDDVDPARVGLWGVSEGGWVAPIAAARSAEVSFLVLVAASGVAPARQTAWKLENMLRRSGVAGSAPNELPLKATRLVAGLGQFPEADFDTAAVLRTVRQPVLAVWGSEDTAVPPAESMAVIRQALERGGNHQYSMKVFPSAAHPLFPVTDGLVDWSRYVDGFYRLVSDWLAGLPDGSGAAGVDPPPKQERVSRPIGPGAWYEAPWLQLAALIVFVLVFAGFLVTGVVRRLLRRERPVVRWPARLLAIAGLLVPVGLVAYIVLLLILQVPGGVMAGVPAPLLVLRLLIAIAIGAAVAVAVLAWRHRWRIGRGERVRLGLLLGAGVLLVPWAQYWGLLVG